MKAIDTGLPALAVRAPGRINLIGEHTDYNEGYVMPATIESHIEFDLQQNGSNTHCHVISETMQSELRADLDGLHPREPGWENYILGVLKEIRDRRDSLRGFNARITASLPRGAGLSSSAALECGLAFGLNALFSLDLTPMELIRLSQLAEHRFAGSECGILDQFACVMGRANQFILLDCRSMEYRYIPSGLGDYELLLVNSGVSHSHASSGYNTRRQECREAAAWLQQHDPQIRSLRDITETHLQEVRETMPDVLFRRCRYVVGENARVLKAADALEKMSLEELGRLLTDSHQGQRQDYEVSCPELDFLVDTANSLEGVLGSRMTGGGFGGCSLVLVHREALPGVREQLAAAYRSSFGRKADFYDVRLGDGVRLVPRDS